MWPCVIPFLFLQYFTGPDTIAYGTVLLQKQHSKTKRPEHKKKKRYIKRKNKMNIVLLFSSRPIVIFVFILLLFAVTSADVALADDSEVNDSDHGYQNISGIRIDLKC